MGLGSDEPEAEIEEESGRHRNTELVIISYLFVFMFLSLAGYLVYLNTAGHKELAENVYNTKQESGSDRVIRGDIVTEDGTRLAYSQIDYTGNESRVYPYGNIFAHIVGYAANGRSGLESLAGNELLSSHSSLLDQLKNTDTSTKPQGDSVVVTLKPKLQEAAWYALGSYKGAVVVMEPDSGKILAMVSKPDFDPNTIAENWEDLVQDSTGSVLLNRAVQGLYPPGSIFKILTTLALLREKPDAYETFRINCEGAMQEGDVTITCYNRIVHGEENLKQAFANSCNTAFATIGLELDKNRFHTLAEEFLFNRSLPFSLPHSRSQFRLDSSSGPELTMTTAIGQGDTLVTPLHMAMITSAVANGGIMMKPYVISGVVNAEQKTVSQTQPQIYDEMMSVEEAEILTQFMEATVLSGTGAALQNGGWYTAAGKTGSAEYEANGEMGTHSWFVGFSNVEDPDIVVAVIAEDGGTGSETAVPIARQIFDAYYS